MSSTSPHSAAIATPITASARQRTARRELRPRSAPTITATATTQSATAPCGDGEASAVSAAAAPASAAGRLRPSPSRSSAAPAIAIAGAAQLPLSGQFGRPSAAASHQGPRTASAPAPAAIATAPHHATARNGRARGPEVGARPLSTPG